MYNEVFFFDGRFVVCVVDRRVAPILINGEDIYSEESDIFMSGDFSNVLVYLDDEGLRLESRVVCFFVS